MSSETRYVGIIYPREREREREREAFCVHDIALIVQKSIMPTEVNGSEPLFTHVRPSIIYLLVQVLTY